MNHELTATTIDRRRLLLGGLTALATAGAASTLLAPRAHAAGSGNVLRAGQQLNPGERITSTNGRFFFIQQSDGNAVLYTGAGSPLWTTRSNGRAGAFLANQTDGNLVCYAPGPVPVWSSGTNGRGAGDLVVQDDGNLVLYTGAGATWSSGTDGGRVAKSSVDKVLDYVRAQIGDPYVSGGTGPDRWDCSGLTQAAFRSVGVEIGRTTYDQINRGRAVGRNDLQPGDLVFVNAGHVAVFSGNGNVVEAPRTGLRVREGAMWGFWAGRRIL